MLSIVIATSNKGKIAEFKDYLKEFPLLVKVQPEDLLVNETGQTFCENACLKACAAAKATGLMALADDSGLSVEALDGAPGIYSSRYASTDSKRILKLIRELKSCQNRNAFFSAALCLAAPNGEVLLEVERRCKGFITNEPRGKSGFGYDPIFEVEDTGLTFAEMNIEEKKLIGHRGRAFHALKPGLKMIFSPGLRSSSNSSL